MLAHDVEKLWTQLVLAMLCKVMVLCEDSAVAMRYYQRQQLFRQRMHGLNQHAEHVKVTDIEKAAKLKLKFGDAEDAQDEAPAPATRDADAVHPLHPAVKLSKLRRDALS